MIADLGIHKQSHTYNVFLFLERTLSLKRTLYLEKKGFGWVVGVGLVTGFINGFIFSCCSKLHYSENCTGVPMIDVVGSSQIFFPTQNLERT